MKKKKTPQVKTPVAVDMPQAHTAPAPAETVSVTMALDPLRMTKRDYITLALFFAFVLVAVTITIGRVSNIAMLLFLLFSIRKSSIANLKEHFSLPVVGLACMILVYGVSGIYSPFGETAVLELFRGLCAFSIAGFVVLRFQKKHVPALLWGFVIIVTIVSVLSLDAASSRVLFQPVADLADYCKVDMLSFDAVSSNRLNGIFNNSNVLASLTALAMLIGLYQIQSGESRKSRFWAVLLLGVNAMTFFLSLSRGGILCFAVALLAYLLLTKKGQRVRLFMLMLFSAVVTVALSMVVMPVMAQNTPLVDLSAVVCGPVIFLLDELFSRRIGDVLGRHGKALVISGAALAVLVVVYVVSAMTVTKPYTFHEDLFFTRAVSLEPGTYSFEADMDDGVSMRVIIKEKDKLILDGWETVYEGTAASGFFEIPANAGRVSVSFVGEQGCEVRSCEFSDGTKVKLEYPLLPSGVANRLQDPLLVSTSFLLRVQYVVDAMKIWATSPLIGRGLSSTDNLYTSVQPFYYQSKFVHNHIVQYLVDTGIVGLCAFLMIVVGLAWLLLRKWKQDGDPLATMFLACLVMMNLHSLMEINFSVRAYAVSAYLLLAIMIVAFGEPLLLKSKEAVKRIAVGTAAAFWVLITVFVGICISYRTVLHLSEEYQTEDYESFMATLERFITFDALDDDYYKVLYLAQGQGVDRYSNNVRKYAMELRESGAFTNCDAVARYYYLPQGRLEDVFACSLEGIRQKAADAVSWNTELDFYRARVLTTMRNDWVHAKEPFIAGVLSFYDALVLYNEGRIEPVELTEDNQKFMDAVFQVWKDPDMSVEDSYALLAQYSEAESEK